MRKLLAIAALAAFGVSTAAAQSSWTQELGIQGGYARVKPAGTGANDAITLFDVPGGSFLFSTLGGGALYMILPWHNKLAVETQLGASQVNSGGVALTVARLGLRGDYALTPRFYAAAGGMAHYVQGFSTDHLQLGVQLAVGYRRKLTSTINGRLEANFTATNKKVLGAADIYAIQLGISTALGARGNSPSRRASNRAWEPAIGISGGYASMHAVGGTGDISGVFFPGAGGDLISAGAPGATAPTMFVIIPIAQKLALEPGVDFHSLAQSGSSVKVINMAVRLDYAVSGNWYAAAGGHLLDVSPSGGGGGTADGVDFALGYRFHLAGAFGGRFETNYALTAKSTKLGTPPINTLSLTFGAIMPLK